MIAPTRVAGTRSARASALALRPSGRMNSSRSTSPGCVRTLGRPGPAAASAVVVNDLDIPGTLVPAEADPPLVVDPDRPLACPVTLQLLEPIARWRPKVVQILGRIEHVELPRGGRANHPQTPGQAATEQLLRGLVPKAADHRVRV